jgi:hypothetical protein
MQSHHLKHLLAGALTALMLLIVVPAAVADPPPGQGGGSGGAPVTAPVDSTATNPAVSPASVDSSATNPAVSPAPGSSSATNTAVSPAPGSSSATNTATPPTSATNSPITTSPASSSATSSDVPRGSASSSATNTPVPAAPASSSATDTPVPAAPASSSSTVQVIWQVQNLGCTAHCQGTSQSQSAQQTNVTVQPISSAQPGDAASGPQNGPQSQTKLVQVQLGCIAHCFGSTTVASPGAVQPTSASPAVPKLPKQESGGEQSVVHQSSLQFQEGLGLVSSQSQVATQVNTSVQDVGSQLDLISALIGSNATDLISALAPNDGAGALAPSDGAGASSPSPGGQSVNQVEQAIWQLQIGCLVFCAQTNQSQQAEQSNTTVGVASDASGLSAVPVSQTNQLVWQLQIGCLFWCLDAVETQTATIVNAVETVLTPTPPSGPGGSPGAEGGSGGSSGSGAGTSSQGAGPGAPLPAAPAGTGLPLIGPPGPGLISAGMAGAGIGGLVRPAARHSARGLTAARPPGSAPAPLGRAATYPLLTSLAARTAPVTIAGETRATRHVPRHRHEARAPRTAATASSPLPPLPLSSPIESAWWLKALFALIALVAVALMVSDLRERRSRRLSG